MHDFIENLLFEAEVPDHLHKIMTVAIHCGLVLLISAAAYLLCRRLISPMVTRMTRHTVAKWDDVIFNPSILSAASFMVFAIVLNQMFPDASRPYEWFYQFSVRVCPILLVVAVVRLINRILKACYMLLGENREFRVHPLKGLLQMLQLVVIIVGVIVSISIVIHKNPVLVLSGLGASAAVLMLVFKDSILGVVAGVQLSANDMLKKGDWIVVPNTPVNGVVQDVTLTTVKVQNFDNTTITVPPYTLVSGSFQNWRGMSDSGGRRIMRSVLIDVRSIRFCTPQELERFREFEWYKGIDETVDATPVNLSVFRCYLEYFVEKFALTKTEYTYMVRHLQPTNEGVPLELYCFTTQTDWKEYEHVQADLFDHIYAVIGYFGLRIYQAPSAADLRSLRSDAPAEVPAFPFAPDLLSVNTPIGGNSKK